MPNYFLLASSFRYFLQKYFSIPKSTSQHQKFKLVFIGIEIELYHWTNLRRHLNISFQLKTKSNFSVLCVRFLTNYLLSKCNWAYFRDCTLLYVEPIPVTNASIAETSVFIRISSFLPVSRCFYASQKFLCFYFKQLVVNVVVLLLA